MPVLFSVCHSYPMEEKKEPTGEIYYVCKECQERSEIKPLNLQNISKEIYAMISDPNQPLLDQRVAMAMGFLTGAVDKIMELEARLIKFESKPKG